jgi:hypothetical protein
MFVKEVCQVIEAMAQDGEVQTVGRLTKEKAEITGTLRGVQLVVRFSMFMTLQSVLEGYGASTDLDVIADGQRIIGTHVKSDDEREMVKAAWELAEGEVATKNSAIKAKACKALGIF